MTILRVAATGAILLLAGCQSYSTPEEYKANIKNSGGGVIGFFNTTEDISVGQPYAAVSRHVVVRVQQCFNYNYYLQTPAMSAPGGLRIRAFIKRHDETRTDIVITVSGTFNPGVPKEGSYQALLEIQPDGKDKTLIKYYGLKDLLEPVTELVRSTKAECPVT